jgi:HJR/Mrr/RecB family endonuclease
MEGANSKTIFVWRDVWVDKELAHLGSPPDFSCPFCRAIVIDNSPTAKFDNSDPMAYATEVMFLDQDAWDTIIRRCPLCGWRLEFIPGFYVPEAPIPESQTMSILKELDINSPKVALAEVGTHLRRRYSDIYGLDWRRFEELICDVFKSNGFIATLTQQSKDGGADVLIFSDNRQQKPCAIVECKKYSANRTVGILTLRALIGAAVDWDVQRAYLVTNSAFSSAVQDKVPDFRKRGFEVDLVAASELLQMFEVYNENLPPLQLLNEELRREIVIANS